MINIELHITCNTLTNDKIESFEKFCYSIKAKPIIILLSKGENKQQPMISKIITCENKGDLKNEIDLIENKFIANGYQITRVKMEVAPWDIKKAENIIDDNSENYFEWHGKFRLENENKAALIISNCGGHISKNVLKRDPNSKFITIREYGTEKVIKQKITKLKRELSKINIDIIKEELEYCIFDSNVSLDKGWI